MRVGRGLIAAAVASLVACGGGGAGPPKMNDFNAYELDQSVWEFEHPMLFVMPVPVFSMPVRITRVELQAVNSTGTFDPPAAYLLVFPPGQYYQGTKLTYELTPSNIAGAGREPLGKRRVSTADNSLSLVIPVNIHLRGCHEAQVVLDVKDADGHTYRLRTRWFVGVDTGVSKKKDLNACAGPAPAPTPTSTAA